MALKDLMKEDLKEVEEAGAKVLSHVFFDLKQRDFSGSLTRHTLSTVSLSIARYW